MKSKKGLVSFIFLILLASAVFFIGWVQLYVPVEQYGVLVSKTNGVDPDVIRNGKITWKWQKLLPTNTVIHVFNAKSEKNIINISGTLPSSEIYRSLIEGQPDFSYSFSFEITASVKPEILPELVEKKLISDDTDLSSLIAKAVHDAAENAARYIIPEIAENSTSPAEKDFSIYQNIIMSDTKLILSEIQKASDYNGVSIDDIKILRSNLPDTGLYYLAKEIYASYLVSVRDALIETTEEQIGRASDDFLLIERFGKLGKVLTDYPILIDYLAVTRDDPDGVLELLNVLRQKLE